METESPLPDCSRCKELEKQVAELASEVKRLAQKLSQTKPIRKKTFGAEGGLSSGTPGQVAPDKLYGLRGAGTDRHGYLYVAMGLNATPAGTLILRSFDKTGKLRWELQNHAFVDTFGFDPDSDGQAVYGRTALFDLDLKKTEPGSEWSLRAITVDPLQKDESRNGGKGATAFLRRLEGRRLLYTFGQMSGRFGMFTFDEPNGLVARPIPTEFKQDGWGWDVSPDGSIWHGDAPDRKIHRFPFGGWSKEGHPKYDEANPEQWSWPEDFRVVTRMLHDASTDSLYLFGYLKSDADDSWGAVGMSARRVDGWLGGKPKDAWTIKLPVTPDGLSKGKPLSGKSVTIVGDYLFLGIVKPQKNRQYIHILGLKDGAYVGSFWPGKEVVGVAGWLDMTYAIQGIQRKDGEYLLLVEKDFRGKNLIYRWRPKYRNSSIF